MWPTFLALAIVSCSHIASQEPATKTPSLTGTVTLAGMPLAIGKITLHLKNGQFHGSQVENGKFAVDVIPAGEYSITIDGKGVPARYSNLEQPILTAKVGERENRIDFDLLNE